MSSSSSSSFFTRDERRWRIYHRFYSKELAQAPITAALVEGDSTALAEALCAKLPAAVTAVTNVKVQKTMGEAFTGGRSTPVYAVSCHVERSIRKTTTRRHFVIKFVDMTLTHPMSNDDWEEPPEDPELLHLRQSYANERRFYDSASYTRLKEQHRLSLPRLVALDFDGTKPRPWVCLVLTDVAAPSATTATPPFDEHPVFLPKTRAKQALHYVAHWHAACWGEDGSTGSAATRLWPRGGFWNAKRHLLLSCKTKKKRRSIATAWTGTTTYLKTRHPHLLTERTKTIGQRLQAMADPLRELWQDLTFVQPYITLIHGDYKAANLFFCACTHEEKEDDDDPQKYVCAVDFQYTGHGLGAFDVAYLLYPDARGAWEEPEEEELLRAYHDALIAALIMYGKGGPSSYPYTLFLAHYHLVRLDLTCYWLEKSGWAATTIGEAHLVAQLERILDEIDGGGDTNSFQLTAEYYQTAIRIYLADAAASP